jgi:phosphoribosylglycinamide formyltransferase-1
MASKRLLFLCSGGGGNLRFVHQAIKRGWLASWQIVAVITDECPASEYARREGLRVNCLDFVADQQATLLQQATSCAPDMVITTVHRILSDDFVRIFDGKLLNLHYSLLPAFGGSIGASPVKAALTYGVRLGGLPHRVNEN